MHILEIPSFFPPHGGLFCLEQARALKARGHEVRILSLTELGMSVDGIFYWRASTKPEWTTMDGVEVYRCYMRDIPKQTYINLWRMTRKTTSMLTDYISRYGMPDVIHVHCCKFAGLYAYILRKSDFDIPYIITEHLPAMVYVKDFGEGWQRMKPLKQGLRRALEGAACVIPVSEELVEDIAPFFGKDYEYEVVSNIVDTDFFAYRERVPREGRPFKYCCLAVADIQRKGYDVLAKAWHDMGDAELHIAGSGTKGLAMKRLFAKCKNVTLHGHLEKEQVRDLLYQCDALVLPTRAEAQVLVPLEAMSTGIPVVITDIVARSVQLPGACLTAPVDDAEAFQEQMLKVQTIPVNPQFHQQVCDLASPEVVAEKIEKIIQSYVIL